MTDCTLKTAEVYCMYASEYQNTTAGQYWRHFGLEVDVPSPFLPLPSSFVSSLFPPFTTR